MIEDFLKSQANPYDIKEVEHEIEEKTVIYITLLPIKTPGKKNNYISYHYAFPEEQIFAISYFCCLESNKFWIWSCVPAQCCGAFRLQ